VSSFGEKYSRFYDILYADKDYKAETKYLVRLFRDFSRRHVQRIIDVACGTGGHTIPLAQKGYKVFAQDLSPYMVKVARDKIKSARVEDRVSLRRGDMRHPLGKGRYDACLCMFGSIGYLPDLQHIVVALRAMRHRLAAEGLLIFDCWNGLAVLTTKPSKRVKTIRRGDTTITRTAIPQLNQVRNICRVAYEVVVREKSKRVEKFSEVHSLRYLFPDEIRLMLELSGFDLASLHPFLKPTASVGLRDWNVTAVARAL
jgi:SAM-dependent methyltransferase